MPSAVRAIRLAPIDRRIAIIAGGHMPARRQYTVTTSPALVAGLNDLFQVAWATATAFSTYLSGEAPPLLDDSARAILRALGQHLLRSAVQADAANKRITDARHPRSPARIAAFRAGSLVAAKILVDKRAHRTLFCHQEKNLQDLLMSWDIRCRSMSRERTGAS